VSDRSGWWNLYRWSEGAIEAILPMEAEFGQPQWVMGMSAYVVESSQRLVCSYVQNGLMHLASLDTQSRKMSRFDLPYTFYWGLARAPGRVVFLAASPSEPAAVVTLDLASGQHQVLRQSSDLDIDARFISQPEPIAFPTTGGREAYALFYRPTNPGYTGPAGELPPLIVRSHGGPTGSTEGTLDWHTQYYTSRGFAVVAVNYGGSTGHGRAYRERLNGQWGVVDVDDCSNAALYLAKQGRVDSKRMAIRGGSAGGYTTLACLTFRDTFHVGASYFGISDLEALALETHKFESRYLDRLVGPYPERRDLYVARSPIHFTDRLSCPMILLQGLEDKVVPPNQAERMAEALKQKGLPVAYVPFEGEQHGFRRAENIQRSLEAELYFYSRVFGFTPHPPVEPVPIDNSDAL
jgi:dipeptidyl aminopeptidase/acylaminoacyl peptidase